MLWVLPPCGGQFPQSVPCHNNKDLVALFNTQVLYIINDA